MHDEEVIRAHATAALAIFRIATHTLEALVQRGILQPSEAADIVREAMTLLPPEELTGASGALMHDTFHAAARRLE